MTDQRQPSFIEFSQREKELAIAATQAETERMRVELQRRAPIVELRDGQLVISREGTTVIVPPEVDADLWEKLRAPFQADEINMLPKGKGSGDEIDCSVCGGRHKQRGIFHVPYVGHARVTNRLNEVDPNWLLTPGPIVIADDLVYMTASMTVLGITRNEVGVCDLDDDDWPKQVYSDAVTRCAMRFGVALDLWMKVTPGQERFSAGRGRRAPQKASNGNGGNGKTTQDPTVAAMLTVLQNDVRNLDMTGAAAWATWKSEHDKWWTKIEALTEARDFVMGLLVEGASDEPF